MNFLDLIIIGIILLGGLAGYRKGLINALIGVISSLVSYVIALGSFKALTPLLDRMGAEKIVGTVLKGVISLPAAKVESTPGTGLDQLTAFTDMLPKPLQQPLNGVISETVKNVVAGSMQSIGDIIIRYVSLAVVSMVAFFLVFMLSKWLLGIVGRIITKSIDRSFLGSINHSGGFLAGVAATTLLISIAVGFISPLLSINVGQGFKTLSQLAQNSVLTPYLGKIFTGLTHALTKIVS